MTNAYKQNPIVLDDFSAAIDLASQLGFAAGTPLKINSIEWETPTTVGDTALLTDKAGGNIIFSETAVVANQSIIKYFYGAYVDNICIAISGVTHGKIIIMLA
jgi:hypothetical protein